MIALFDGEIDKLCIFHKPESLHFGVKEDQLFNGIASLLGSTFPFIASTGQVAAFSKDAVPLGVQRFFICVRRKTGAKDEFLH
jgi:hypothetical protein